jgi:hypothetical protein
VEADHLEERTTAAFTVPRGGLRQRVSEEENSKRAIEFLLCDITVEYICFVFQE